MKLIVIAAAIAVLAAPVFAEKEPMITVEQCETEKLQLLIDILQDDIAQLREDLKEVVGDQSEDKIRPRPRPEKFYEN